MARLSAVNRKVCSRGHDQRGLNFCPVCNPGRAHRVALIQTSSSVDDYADRLHVSAMRDRWADALGFVRRITPFAR